MEKSLAEKLYEYLKEKYGIQGTEFTFEKENIPKGIQISIPGIPKNSDRHKWVAFLEEQNSESKGIGALIIGQECKKEDHPWSRYIEVKNSDSSVGSGWFKITDSTFMGPGYDFKSLIIFLEVLKDFSEKV